MPMDNENTLCHVMSFRGALPQSVIARSLSSICHCEERSDEANFYLMRLLRPCGARNDMMGGDCFASSSLAMTKGGRLLRPCGTLPHFVAARSLASICHCEERSDEANFYLRRLLRSFVARNDMMGGDCFASSSLAMTKGGRLLRLNGARNDRKRCYKCCTAPLGYRFWDSPYSAVQTESMS
jgi:hypothetical protein